MSRYEASSFDGTRDRYDDTYYDDYAHNPSNMQARDLPPRPSSVSPSNRRAVQVVYTRSDGQEYRRGQYVYEHGKMRPVSPGFYERIPGEEEEHRFSRTHHFRSSSRDKDNFHTSSSLHARREASREACFLRLSRERDREEHRSPPRSYRSLSPDHRADTRAPQPRYSLSPLPIPQRPYDSRRSDDGYADGGYRRSPPSPPAELARYGAHDNAHLSLPGAAHSHACVSGDTPSELARFGSLSSSGDVDLRATHASHAQPELARFNSITPADEPRPQPPRHGHGPSHAPSRGDAGRAPVSVVRPGSAGASAGAQSGDTGAAMAIAPRAASPSPRALTVVLPQRAAASPSPTAASPTAATPPRKPVTVVRPGSLTAGSHTTTASPNADAGTPRPRICLPARSPFKSALKGKRAQPGSDTPQTPCKGASGDDPAVPPLGASQGSLLSPSLGSNLSLLFSPLRSMWRGADDAADAAQGTDARGPRVIRTSKSARGDAAHADGSAGTVFESGLSRGISVIPLEPLPNPHAPHTPDPALYANSPHMHGAGKVVRRRPDSNSNAAEGVSPRAARAGHSPGRVHWDTCIVRVRKIPGGDRRVEEAKRAKGLRIVKRGVAREEDAEEEENWGDEEQVLPGEVHLDEGELRYSTVEALYSDEEEDGGVQSGLFGVVLAEEEESSAFPCVDIASHERKGKNNVNNASSPLVKRAFHPSVCHLPLQTLVYAHPRYMTGLQPFAALLDELRITSVLALANWRWYQLAKELVAAAERESACADKGAVYWRKEDRHLREQLDDACAKLTFAEAITKDCTVFADLPGRVAGLIERDLGHTSIAELAADPMFENAEVVVREWRKGAHRLIYTHNSNSNNNNNSNSGAAGDKAEDTEQRPSKRRKV